MRRVLDLQSAGRGFKSYPGQKLRNNLRQVVHTYVPLTKQYNLVPAKGQWCFAAGKVTAGLAESNSTLPPVGWLIVTCGLTGCTPGSAPGPTLGNEYGKPLSFLKLRLPAFVQSSLELVTGHENRVSRVKSDMFSRYGHIMRPLLEKCLMDIKRQEYKRYLIIEASGYASASNSSTFIDTDVIQQLLLWICFCHSTLL